MLGENVVVPRNTPRIVIVGVCGSGKTVLADALVQLGYNARAMAQEHSFVPGMWRAHGQPNVLIYLDATAETINQRLGRQDWSPEALAEQHRRLADAHTYCDIYLHTDDLSEAEVLEHVVTFLSAGWSAEPEREVREAAAKLQRGFLHRPPGRKRSSVGKTSSKPRRRR
jgi:broad-specificity NMP kinase